MKKTIFTFSAIAIVCSAIFFACAKDDNSAVHTTYVSQSSGGTGTNPDPNHTNTLTTTPNSSVTPTNTTTNFTVDGAAAVSPTASGSVNSSNFFQILSLNNTASTSIQIVFSNANAPATGAYNIVSAAPGANQCQFILTTSGSNVSTASSGVVNITTGSPLNTASFTGIICTGSSNHTATGTIKY